MKRMFRTAIAAVCAIVSFISAAADFDDYVWLMSNDEVKIAVQNSFDDNSAMRWTNHLDNAIDDLAGPHSGAKYYVPEKRTLCTTNISNGVSANADPVCLVFGGEELAVAGQFRIGLRAESTYPRTDPKVSIKVPDMRLLSGSLVNYIQCHIAALLGNVTVEGTAASPAQIRQAGNIGTSSDDTFIGASLVADSDAVLQLAAWSTAGEHNENFILYGETSQYRGTILATNSLSTIFLEKDGGCEFPGTFSLSRGATLAVTNGATATIGKVVSDGGALRAVLNSATTPFVVTNSVVNNGTPIALKLKLDVPATHDAQYFPILALAADAEGSLSADDFSLESFDWTAESGFCVTNNKGVVYKDAVNWRLVVKTDETTSLRTLYIAHDHIVYLKTSDADANGSAFLPANKEHWSDGNEISSENDYYVIDKNLRLPKDTSTFGGNSLTVLSAMIATTLNSGSYNVTIDDMRWYPLRSAIGSDIGYQFNILGDTTIKGNVSVLENGENLFMLWCYNKKTLTLESEIGGAGHLGLSTSRTSADPTGNYAFSGMNTNYTGNIRLWHDAFTNSVPISDPYTYCISLTVSDQRNLGGALPAFSAKALSLESYSILKVDGSVVFDEPTRGWSAVGVGRIEVAEDETATVTNKQITYSGEFRKEGAGTLRLGGTARFTADALETPLAGTNVLRIAAGALTPADTTAFDGLAVSFAAGAKLVIDASAEGDLKEYGLYDVKWNTPIAVDGDAALPVELSLPAGFNKNRSHRFGICTVSATAAQSLDVSSFAVSRVEGMSTVVNRYVNGNGTVTFACDLAPKGCMLIFR